MEALKQFEPAELDSNDDMLMDRKIERMNVFGSSPNQIVEIDSQNNQDKSVEEFGKSIELNLPKSKVVHTHDINGVTFNLVINESIIITHPQWSLTGMGNTLLNAELDMIQDAKIIADEYINTPDHKLSQSSIEFKKFLLDII